MTDPSRVLCWLWCATVIYLVASGTWAAEPNQPPTVFTIVYDANGNLREKGEPRSFYEPLGYKGFPGALKRKYINMNAVPRVVGHVGDIVRFTRMGKTESEWTLISAVLLSTPAEAGKPAASTAKRLVVIFTVTNAWSMKQDVPVEKLTVTSLQNRQHRVFEPVRLPSNLLPKGSTDVMDDPSVGPGLTQRFAVMYEVPPDVTMAEIGFPGLFPVMLDSILPMTWGMDLGLGKR